MEGIAANPVEVPPEEETENVPVAPESTVEVKVNEVFRPFLRDFCRCFADLRRKNAGHPRGPKV
eukprot:scaffold875_cov222-Pinguiococcus_pyrenoidosus.AAC.3